MFSKFDGFQRIQELALPHPNWKFIQKKEELPINPWCNADVGWSVRFASKVDYKFALPSKHHLNFDDIYLFTGDTLSLKRGLRKRK